MNPAIIFGVFLVLAVVWTGIWLWVLVSSRRPAPYPGIYSTVNILRRRLFYAILAIAIVVFGISMFWLPYPLVRAETVGKPQLVVNATGQQWFWTLSQRNIPVGVPVEFVVTAKDVNHDFAVYNPQGHVVTQVQAMPGHPNHLIYKFDQPGVYTVRCLEYCGLGHTGMITTLTVQ